MISVAYNILLHGNLIENYIKNEFARESPRTAPLLLLSNKLITFFYCSHINDLLYAYRVHIFIKKSAMLQMLQYCSRIRQSTLIFIVNKTHSICNNFYEQFAFSNGSFYTFVRKEIKSLRGNLLR